MAGHPTSQQPFGFLTSSLPDEYEICWGGLRAYGFRSPGAAPESRPRGYNPAMRVEDIGEFDLIDILIEVIERRGLDRAGPEGRLLTIGAGDDAAAWEGPAGVEVLTNDVMVEGVHFDLATIGWRDLGWKCVAVNLSDVAAMGCLPGFAVVALGLPGGLRVADLVEMYEGMLDACERYGCALVGGDVVHSPTFFVSVAVTGMAQTGGDGPASQPLLARDGARVGDLVAVTGHVGCSAGGLRMMTEGQKLDDETRDPS